MALEESVKEEDSIFTAGEVKFAVDKSTVPYLAGAVLDYTKTWHGGGFTISTNKRGSCSDSCSTC
jgi:Fe-S cluster assembly iron-binding protein IscA